MFFLSHPFNDLVFFLRSLFACASTSPFFAAWVDVDSVTSEKGPLLLLLFEFDFRSEDLPPL